MLFNTYVYAVFLMIVYLLYQALPLRGRQLMLLLASYTFYCWEQPFYGCLLVISTENNSQGFSIRTYGKTKREVVQHCGLYLVAEQWDENEEETEEESLAEDPLGRE